MLVCIYSQTFTNPTETIKYLTLAFNSFIIKTSQKAPIFVLSFSREEYRMDLIRVALENNQQTIKTTVLCRPNGSWLKVEVSQFCDGLMTEVSGHPDHPEYLILFGHYTKEETLRALMGGVAYTAVKVVGIKELPFRPSFI